MIRRPPRSPLFPYPTLFRSVPLDSFRRQLDVNVTGQLAVTQAMLPALRRARGRIVMVSTIGVRFSPPFAGPLDAADRKSTRLNSSHSQISYAVFCLKKKQQK